MIDEDEGVKSPFVRVRKVYERYEDAILAWVRVCVCGAAMAAWIWLSCVICRV